MSTALRSRPIRAFRPFGVAVLAILGLAIAGLGATSAAADTAPPSGSPATVSADVLATWQLNGVVLSEVTVGNTVYATGSFTRARPPGVAAGGTGEIAANNIFAFDITTGNRVASFSHSLNAQGLAITASPDGSRVYVAGSFTTVDGQTRNRVAAFSTATGDLVGFAPSVSGTVHSITASNSTVYVGGAFNSVNGAARGRLAAISASTGSPTSWAASADADPLAMVLSPDGSRLIVGGHFTKLNSTSANGMGAVSTSSGATQSWAANTTIKDSGQDAAILSLRTDGTLIYGSGYSYHKGGNFEGEFAADPNTGKIIWLNDCLGDTYDVMPVGQVLYTVGHPHDCSSIGSFPDIPKPDRVYHRATAFTTYATGKNTGPNINDVSFKGVADSSLLAWYPTLAAGSVTGQTQGAWAVTGNSSYLALGGEFPTVNGIAQQGLVRFAIRSIAPNKVGPQSSTALTPTAKASGSTGAKISWASTWDLDNQTLTYRLLRDGSTTPIYTNSIASSFWQLPSQSFTDSGLAKGTHTYAVQAVDPLGNVRTSATSAPITIK